MTAPSSLIGGIARGQQRDLPSPEHRGVLCVRKTCSIAVDYYFPFLSPLPLRTHFLTYFVFASVPRSLRFILIIRHPSRAKLLRGRKPLYLLPAPDSAARNSPPSSLPPPSLLPQCSTILPMRRLYYLISTLLDIPVGATDPL